MSDLGLFGTGLYAMILILVWVVQVIGVITTCITQDLRNMGDQNTSCTVYFIMNCPINNNTRKTYELKCMVNTN